uniref:hypothetical protein n=1 Tax=Chroodactylon ornatum TaxID=139907 RepID=UPI001FCDF873|nr:hypothetical protein MW609_pgp093 [Chroodactylon ornatum]UNJ14606.1 hypothetical protein [Chroodactylon ornatum]
MSRQIQLYKITRTVPFELTLKIGHFGNIVGTKSIRYSQAGYIIEFADNIRMWVLPYEIKFIK